MRRQPIQKRTISETMSDDVKKADSSTDKADDITFRKPESQDGSRVHKLISECKPLDENSVYCNLLQCTHFADTSVAAEMDGDLVGLSPATSRRNSRMSCLSGRLWSIRKPAVRGQAHAGRTDQTWKAPTFSSLKPPLPGQRSVLSMSAASPTSADAHRRVHPRPDPFCR